MQNITILYVDDEQTNLILFEYSFKGIFNVITAVSGPEGLDKLEDYKDDIIVVISDMRMPKMNGIQFIKEARKKFNNIAYFILTAFDYNDEIDEALKGNVIHKFFTKPFKINEIKNAVMGAVKELGLENRIS
jgi:response regulator RpfG family c-di-GMP phosphodiesterase